SHAWPASFTTVRCDSRSRSLHLEDPMRPHLSRLTVWLTVLVALVALSSRVNAQCAITGPSEVCGSAVTLCAPDGAEVYEWTLPDGSQQWTQCITVTEPGSYSMRYFDPLAGNWTTP